MKKLIMVVIVLVMTLSSVVTFAAESTKEEIKLVHYEVREGDLK